MLSELSRAKLASGETARVVRLQTPEESWRDKVVPLLAHKGKPWVWQIEQTLSGEIAPLESYYYLALVGEEVAGNVCTFEQAGGGILGHVFTRPEHRRKGICRAILEAQSEDFRARGGRALFLGTGAGSTAWNIYHSFGFRPVYPGTGFMELYTESIDEYESSFFAPADVVVREADWRDWAGATCLTAQRSGSALRLVGLQAYDRTSLEGSYLEVIRGIRDTGTIRAAVLESRATGATVGIAVLQPDSRFPGTALLDLFAHPSFAEHSTKLLEHLIDAIDERAGKIQAYAASGDESKIAALAAAGFRVEATFTGQMNLRAGVMDLTVLAR